MEIYKILHVNIKPINFIKKKNEIKMLTLWIFKYN